MCKPNLQSSYGQGNYYNTPHYSPAGIGYPPHFKEHSTYPNEYSTYYEDNSELTFRRDPNHAQNLAYSGYSHYRNAGGGEIEASSKKSILPDS